MSVFHQKLNELTAELHDMSGLVVRAIDRGIDAFLGRDADLAQQVIDEDNAIDQHENRMDAHCLALLNLNQPYADDFRVLITTIKVNHSLERVGDHAKALCKCVQALVPHYEYPVPPAVRHLSNLLPDMVHAAIRALQHADVELAEKVRQRDELVNAAYGECLAAYIKTIQDEPERASDLVRLCEAMKHLERCGDVAKNIAKDVIYLVEGRNVRHEGLAPDHPPIAD